VRCEDDALSHAELVSDLSGGVGEIGARVGTRVSRPSSRGYQYCGGQFGVSACVLRQRSSSSNLAIVEWRSFLEGAGSQ
jgi:hypothetical protein